MTPEQVRRRVAAIQATYDRHDNEPAHIDEDRLWQEVLTAIAEGVDNAAELAQEALHTRREYSENSRWYA